MQKNRTAVGIYSTDTDVEHIFMELKLAGFPAEHISVLFSAHGGPETFIARVSEASATRDGALKWLMEIGARSVLTAGSTIAAGPIAAALALASKGGRAGTLIKVLASLGIQEHEAKSFERRIRNGGFLVIVHPDDLEWTGLAREILEGTGAGRVWSTDEASAAYTRGEPLPRTGID